MKATRIVLATMTFLSSVSAFGVESEPAPVVPAATFIFVDPKPAFIIYLGKPEVPAPEVEDYLNGLDQFLRLLGNHDTVGARRVLISLASNAELDGGLCDELSHRIDTTMAILRQKDTIKKIDQVLQSSLTIPDQSHDNVADALREQSEAERNPNSTVDPAAPDSSLSTHLTENYLKDTQTREAISSNDRNYLLLVDQCRSDFAAYIAALEAAGHVRQVSLAAACYRWLFPALDDSQIREVVAICHDKTVSLDQMITTVQEESTRHHLLAVAAQLEAAYQAGPDDPRLQGIPLALKKPVLTFIFEEEKLREALQAKDLDACEKLLPKMSREAGDFDIRPLQAHNEAIRKKSQFLVNQAESEMQRGHTATVLEDFQAASIAWPQNPALQGGAIDLVLRQQTKLESLRKFDEYWTQGDYGSLVSHAPDFTPWIDGDAHRQEVLAQAQKKVRSADLAIEQATALQAAGHGAQAWETIELVSRSWPANTQLTKLKLVVAPTATNFVRAIEKAEEAEKKNNLGLSLSWYAIAEQSAGQSLLAREGILRIVGKILH